MEMRIILCIRTIYLYPLGLSLWAGNLYFRITVGCETNIGVVTDNGLETMKHHQDHF